MTTGMLEAALAYARAGWPVFPCDPRQDLPDTPPEKKRAKRPLVPGAELGTDGKKIPKTGGLWRATTDEAQIRVWWKRTPTALIGVPTGSRIGAFVVDLDPRGESVDDVFSRLVEVVGLLPDGPRSETQSGGLHLWFALPEGEAELPKNSAGRLRGVDWRGDGGYVILPPSTMSDGAAYRWVYAPDRFIGFGRPIGGAEATTDFARVPPPPAALLDLIYRRGAFARRAGSADPESDAPRPTAADAFRVDRDAGERAVRRYAQVALDNARAEVARAVKGTRGETLNKVAFTLGPFVALGVVSEREVVAALRDGADASGLTATDGATERDAKIRRGLEAGQADSAPLARRLDEIREDALRREARYARPPAAPLPDAVPDGPGWSGYARPDGDYAGGVDEALDPGAPADDLDAAPPAYDEMDPGTPPPIDGLADAIKIAEACAALDHSDTDNGQRLIRHFGRDMLVLAYEGIRNVDYVVWAGTHWDLRTGSDAAFRRAQEIGPRIMLEADYLAMTPDERRAIEAVEKAVGGATDAQLKAADEARASLEKRQIARRKFGVSSKNKARLEAMLVCAAPHLTTSPDAFNAHPLRLATMTHTIEFRRARIEGDSSVVDAGFTATPGHKREHLITRALPVAYDPDAQAPRWIAFLEEFLPDDDVRTFVQTFSGLGLTGLPIQKLIYHYGTGANGKSVFLEVITRVLGDLAVTLQSETITGMAERSAQQASPDLARLFGKWFTRVPELPQEEPIREALVKKLTGGEAIPVRNLFKGLFEFIPLAKAHMSGNGFPRIDGTDNGIWRRMAVVHWPVTLDIARQRNFAEVVDEFMQEAPGILNWLLAGAVTYLAEGLAEPEAVRIATQDYRDEMDPIGMFVLSCVEPWPGGAVRASDLFQAYERWCEANGLKPCTPTKFGKIMKTKVKRVEGAYRTYVDVRLKDVPDATPRSPGDDMPF